MTNIRSSYQSETQTSVMTLTGESEKKKQIACVICQARYAASPTHTTLSQAPETVLESAFMSMCHFCFRCRRPSCPSCWDDVNGVCGSCALEAQLPFRAQPRPLHGTLFTPTRRAQLRRLRPLASPLVCIRPGRFQRAPLPIDMVTTLQLPALQTQAASEKQLSVPSPSSGPSPIDLELPALPQPAPSPQPVSVSQTAETLAARATIAEITTRPERRKKRTTSILETLLTSLLLSAPTIIIVLIIAAAISADINILILHILHINIRTEITYLWLLLSHLQF